MVFKMATLSFPLTHCRDWHLHCSGQIIGSGGATHEMMAGVGTAALQNRAALGGGAALPPPPHIAPQPLKMLRRQHKKAEKKAKKQVDFLMPSRYTV